MLLSTGTVISVERFLNGLRKKSDFCLYRLQRNMSSHSALTKSDGLIISLNEPQSACAMGASLYTLRRRWRKGEVAFTLAEVLITLGIIGVVAALTMPAVMSHYRKQEASARLKKFYSAMNQAIQLSEVENGEFKYWDIAYRQPTFDDGTSDYSKFSELGTAFFYKYLAKYLKYDKFTEGNATNDEDGNKTGEFPKIYFYDGTIVEIYKGACVDLVVDINGEKKPNEKAYDQFSFLICTYGSPHALFPGEKLSTYDALKAHSDRNKALEACKNNQGLCTRLLQLDNWEFKDDYPYKL